MDVPRAVRTFVLIVSAVSRKAVNSGLKAGRQAARIPVFNSTLRTCQLHQLLLQLQGILLVPNLK